MLCVSMHQQQQQIPLPLRHMEIEIPSPSVFLRQSPARVINESSNPLPKKKVAKPRATVKKTNTTAEDGTGAVTKPKQSKSRNGCMTCKKKRLKCDETKPSCVQCQKRNVACEGYKKDFKWRSFEETTFSNKTTSKRKASNPPDTTAKKPKVPADDPAWPLDFAFASASHAIQGVAAAAIVSPSNSIEPPLVTHIDPVWSPPRFNAPSPGSTFDLNTTQVQRDVGSHSPSFTGSPTLLDLLLPGTDMNQPPDLSEERPPMSPAPYQPGPFVDSMHADEEADEEIFRDTTNWRHSSPAPSEGSSVSSKSSGLTIMAGPDFDMSSPEMLLVRFDRNTCGILSVKDGPTENPWRTLVWPLAQDSPALYHAISSMTAFHGANQHPELRITGMAHMHKSIKKLAADISSMRLDSALATSLALALGEGWDEKTSTGIQHLRGAKVMVNNALVRHRQNNQLGLMSSEESARLRFLCNTFIYLDVIARLTSTVEAQELNFDEIMATINPPTLLQEVDPLMGCATTLFPIIGRIATLVRKVREVPTNSLNIVSQANDLQQQLLQWQTPDSSSFTRPEDPSSEVEHSIRTAEAYRIATLLYLHQAVPEIPSDAHEAMAKRVLVLLASVPLSSRTVIVQIFPLFAASCEVTKAEDRAWVIERWLAMMDRLAIGNIDSCWRVVQEVWQRRDQFEMEKAQRLMRLPNLPRRSTMTDIPLDQIAPEYTVRGRLHWIGVMSDWKWEVFLG